MGIPEPKAVLLKNLFEGNDTQYIVPAYQRDYSWNMNQIEELWSDIKKAFEDKDDQYFMGAIVLTPIKGSTSKFSIVDGQQRLLTFTILISVLNSIFGYIDDNKKMFKKNEDDLEDAQQACHDIRKLMIISKGKYFVEPNKKEKKSFEDEVLKNKTVLFEKNDLKINNFEKRYIKARKFFFSKLTSTFLTLDAKETPTEFNSKIIELVYFLRDKINFIKIEVGDEGDAYTLFETLNSKGLDLTVADLLKNHLLRCSDEKVRENNGDQWSKVSSDMDSSNLNIVDFLRFYWQAFEEKTTSKALYKKMSKKINTKNVELYLENFVQYSEFFLEWTEKSLIYPSVLSKKDKAKITFGEINTLGYTLPFPMFLLLKKERPKSLKNVAEKTKNFLFRFITIGDYSVGSAEEVMNNVIDLVRDHSATEKEILDAINHDNVSNKEFEKNFAQAVIKKPETAKYILCKIEDFKQVSPSKVISKKHINLEHILPKDSSKWSFKESPSKSIITGEKLKSYKDRIGNLTIFEETLNKSIKNSEFKAKLKTYKAKKSVFTITNEIESKYSSKEWTAQEIEERSKAFAKLAIKIWPMN